MSSSSTCIVGGSGFLGTSIAQLLSNHGKDFTIVDIKQSVAYPQSCRFADVRSAEQLFLGVKGDTLLLLAAVHRDDVRPVSLYDDVNVTGTENLCKAAEAAGIERIVFASSVAVYGFAPKDTDEDGKIAPFNDYGRTKWAAEEVLRQWQAKDAARRSLTIIRPTVIFGPGNRGNVYNLFRQIASGKFLMFGSGNNTKSIAYIENVAAFFVHCLAKSPGLHIFNYVDTPDFSMNELVRTVRAELGRNVGVGLRLPLFAGWLMGAAAEVVSNVTGKRLPISRIRVRKFASTTSFCTKFDKIDGFSPPLSLREGVKKTINAEFLNPDETRTIFLTE